MTVTKIRQNRLRLKIQEARSYLLDEWPYFGLLSMYLRFVAVDNIRNISTNGKCIYFNPNFLDKLSFYETQFVICHQIMHIVYGDIWRDSFMQGDDYHRAFDVIVNDVLIKMGWRDSMFSHLGKLQYKLKSTVYEDIDLLTVEEIYEMFPFKLSQLDEAAKNRYMADSDYWWDHKDDEGESGIIILDIPKMTKHSDEPEQGENNIGLGDTNSDMKIPGTKKFWEDKSRMAENSVSIRCSEYGRTPKGAKRSVNDVNRGELDWKKLIDVFIQEEISDYSFSPPDRRYTECDFFLPDFNEKEFVPCDILFMVDTSGSIGQRQLEIVYGELKSALEQFKGKLRGKLGFFDTEVTPPIPFSTVAQLKSITPYGGGGTDFTSIFKYVREEMSDDLPKAIVIFTDGYGKYPCVEETFGIPVLWLLDSKKENIPFGKVARILTEKSA